MRRVLRLMLVPLLLLFALGGATAQPPAQEKPHEPPKILSAAEVRQLIAALKDKARRKQAVLDLADGGPAARAAVPALVKLLREEKTDTEVRLYAAYALEKLETAK